MVEVIISITIIGVITSIAIPSYQIYNSKSQDLLIKEKSLVIKNELMAYINNQLMNDNISYPIFGISSSTYLQTNNISSNDLATFSRSVVSYSTILDYSKFKSVTVGGFSGFVKGVGAIVVRVVYSTKEYIDIEYQITDNQLNYKDVAVISGFTYVNENGLSYYVKM